MQAKKKRRIWPIVLIIIVVLIAAGIFGLDQLSKSTMATIQGAAIEEVAVKTGEITSTVTATGNIAAGISEIYVPYDIEIGEIDVEVGEAVVEGERLLRVETWSINQEIKKAEDDIKDIDKKISENGERADYLTLKEHRQVRLDSLKALKDNREIYANASGIITKVNIDDWAKYNRPSETETDTTYTENAGIVMEIAPVDKYSILVSVDELDILSIEVGQVAKVTMDALPDEEFEATVEKVYKETVASSGVAKYSVLLSLPKSDSMRVGMNASVVIATKKAENVLVLPAIAIQEEAGETFVYTTRENDGKLAGKKTITTGLSDGKDVEIATGLSDEEKIYYNIKVSSTEEMMMMAFGDPSVSTSAEEVTESTSEGGEG